MQILDEQQVAALTFVSAANRGGYRPTAEEVEAWINLPGRHPGRPRRLIRKGRPAQSKLVRDALGTASFIQGVMRQYEMDRVNLMKDIISFANPTVTPAEPDEYDPGEPPETLTDSLRRLRWIQRDEKDSRLSLTALGTALLRSHDLLDEDLDSATAVYLGSNDELAYPKLIHRLVEAEEGALVDPYLRLEQLARVVTQSTISRVLVSAALSKAELAGIATFIDSHNGGALEVRVAKRGVLHDRLILGEKFVDTIGTSFNTVGKKHPTVLSPLPEYAAQAMREHFETWWRDADHLASTPSPVEKAAIEAPANLDTEQAPEEADSPPVN